MMQYSTCVFLGYTLSGFSLLFAGIFGIFQNSMACRIINIIFLLLALAAILPALFSKTEPSDEMAQLHLYKAKSCALYAEIVMFTAMAVVVSICGFLPESMALSELPDELTFSRIFPFFISVAAMTVGIKFHKLEKDGD